MPKFKENDVVKCIDNTDVPSLVLGMNYRVRDCSHMYVELSVDYLGDNYVYVPNKFNPERFELTDEEVTYKWPIRQSFKFIDDEDDEEGATFGKPSYEELEIRLEISERLLHDGMIIAAEFGFEEFVEQVDEFLEGR